MTKTTETPTVLNESALDAVTAAGICDRAFCKVEGIKGEVHSFDPVAGDGEVTPIDALVVINR